MIVAAATVDWPQIVDKLLGYGPFPSGLLIGAAGGGWLTSWLAKIAVPERVKQQELAAEREKEFFKQLSIKDERIDKLHKELWRGGLPERANPPDKPEHATKKKKP